VAQQLLPGTVEGTFDVVRKQNMVQEGGPLSPGGDEETTDDLSLAGFRRTHFLRVLESCGNDIDEAARILGVSPEVIRRELQTGVVPTEEVRRFSLIARA
jgi:hypothetical protein